MEAAIRIEDLRSRFGDLYSTYDLAYKESRELLEDYLFMQGLMSRLTKKETGMVSIGVQINLSGFIYDKFVKDLFKDFFATSSTAKEDMAERLYAFYCVKGVFEELCHQETYQNESMENQLVKDLILLEGYFQWMEGIELFNYIGCFVGCSSQCGYIKGLINKTKEASK